MSYRLKLPMFRYPYRKHLQRFWTESCCFSAELTLKTCFWYHRCREFSSPVYSNFQMNYYLPLLFKIKERGISGMNTGVAALTKYKTLDSAGMIDITNNQSVSWIQAHLTNLSHKYQIDSFYLDMGKPRRFFRIPDIASVPCYRDHPYPHYYIYFSPSWLSKRILALFSWILFIFIKIMAT